MTYAQHLATFGGMASCGNHLGIMVTPRKNVEQVPAGWVFIPLEDATEEIVQEALDHARQGRSAWPQKVEYNLPKRSKANVKKIITHF